MTDKKIKIVFLAGGLGLGGSERQLYLNLKYLDREKFDPHVIVFNPNQDYFYSPLNELGIHIWEIPLNYKNLFRRLWFVHKILRFINPDIVHSWVFHDNPYAGIAGFLANVPVRIGSQRNSYYSKTVQDLNLVLKYLSLYSIAPIIVNSNNVLNDMVSAGYDRERIVYLPNIVEVAKFNEHGNSLYETNDVCVDDRYVRIIGIIGNLRRQKNLFMFLDVMATVLDHYHDVHGLIVGQQVETEPEILEELKLQIRMLDIADRVTYLGCRTDIPQLLGRIKILCLTSDYEGMPNVVLEAMAAARPVVATRVGGVPELIENGVNGYLIEPGEVDAFSEAIIRLLENPGMAIEMGIRGQKKVLSRHASQQVSNHLSDLYLSLLSNAT